MEQRYGKVIYKTNKGGLNFAGSPPKFANKVNFM